MSAGLGSTEPLGSRHIPGLPLCVSVVGGPELRAALERSLTIIYTVSWKDSNHHIPGPSLVARVGRTEPWFASSPSLARPRADFRGLKQRCRYPQSRTTASHVDGMGSAQEGVAEEAQSFLVSHVEQGKDNI